MGNGIRCAIKCLRPSEALTPKSRARNEVEASRNNKNVACDGLITKAKIGKDAVCSWQVVTRWGVCFQALTGLLVTASGMLNLQSQQQAETAEVLSGKLIFSKVLTLTTMSSDFFAPVAPVSLLDSVGQLT